MRTNNVLGFPIRSKRNTTQTLPVRSSAIGKGGRWPLFSIYPVKLFTKDMCNARGNLVKTTQELNLKKHEYVANAKPLIRSNLVNDNANPKHVSRLINHINPLRKYNKLDIAGLHITDSKLVYYPKLNEYYLHVNNIVPIERHVTEEI